MNFSKPFQYFVKTDILYRNHNSDLISRLILARLRLTMLMILEACKHAVRSDLLFWEIFYGLMINFVFRCLIHFQFIKLFVRNLKYALNIGFNPSFSRAKFSTFPQAG